MKPNRLPPHHAHCGHRVLVPCQAAARFPCHRLAPPRHLAGVIAATVLTAGSMLAPPAARAGANAAPGSVAERLRNHVTFLADDDREGRLTGTEGELAAARYLSKQLADIGLVPLVGDDFIVPFDFTAGSRDSGSSLSVSWTDEDGEPTRWATPDTVQALSFSDVGSTSGPVVFAGYGIRIPDSQDFGYDSYATLDVKDKIVVILRYFPEDAEGEARGTLARYSGPRFKAMTARQLGAKALLVVTGPRSPNAGEVMPMTFDTAIAGSGILAASVSAAVAEKLFRGDKPLAEIQAEFDTANPHIVGFDLADVALELDVQLERERSSGRNVIGLLPATSSDQPSPGRIALGAHFDHLGRGKAGNSLARTGEVGAVHNGADDNASGTAAVVEIVKALQDRTRARDLVVAFWSGEELGLLGANAFVRSDESDLDRIEAYVNLDMVGRARENKLSVQAVGSSADWPAILEQSNVMVGWNLQLQEDPYLPTDSAAFHRAEIPTLNFFTGSHSDYHRPSDDVEHLDFDELARVVELGQRVGAKLLDRGERLAFTKVEPKRRGGGDRDTVRAFTGTIPDYATDVAGLLLGGVIAGGPAEEAGLRAGDVIVKFAEQSIANIYDYTYALDAVKIDQPLEVEYLRGGERKTTVMTPRARD